MNRIVVLLLVLMAQVVWAQGSVQKVIGSQPYVNYFINAGADFSQRYGTATTNISGSYAYYLDRWQSKYTGSWSGSVTVRQYCPSNRPRVKCDIQHGGNPSSSSSSTVQSMQRIEAMNARSLSSINATVSLYTWSTSANQLELVCSRAGAEDDFSSPVSFYDQTVSLTVNNWTRVVFPVIAMPSLARYGIQCEFIFKNMTVTGSSTAHEMAGMMLNEGSSPATFSLAGGDVQGELAKCQRYAYDPLAVHIVASGSLGAGMAFTATTGRVFIPFPVSMRIVPTISTVPAYVTNDLAAIGANGAGLNIANQPTIESISSNGAYINFTSATGLVSGNATLIRCNVAQCHLLFVAEL